MRTQIHIYWLFSAPKDKKSRKIFCFLSSWLHFAWMWTLFPTVVEGYFVIVLIWNVDLRGTPSLVTFLFVLGLKNLHNFLFFFRFKIVTSFFHVVFHAFFWRPIVAKNHRRGCIQFAVSLNFRNSNNFRLHFFDLLPFRPSIMATFNSKFCPVKMDSSSTIAVIAKSSKMVGRLGEQIFDYDLKSWIKMISNSYPILSPNI